MIEAVNTLQGNVTTEAELVAKLNTSGDIIPPGLIEEVVKIYFHNNIDDKLDEESENPLQNKVIAELLKHVDNVTAESITKALNYVPADKAELEKKSRIEMGDNETLHHQPVLKIRELTREEFEEREQEGAFYANEICFVEDPEYVTPEQLNAEVTSALTKAKEEGTFDGKDGYSPSARVESTENGALITVTDESGTTTTEVKNGKDGYTPEKNKDYFDGKDGYSPTAKVEKTNTTSKITITDKAGTTTAEVKDGKDGNDATVKVGTLNHLEEITGLTFYEITEEEYDELEKNNAFEKYKFYLKEEGDYLTEETDPTVPSWAKAPTKPSYTASEVGADVSGTAESKVSAHNVSPTAHNDIRLLIQDITTQLTNFLDVDDTTVDQLSEVLTLINNNKGTLESLTTSKINVSAIVDNLTTADSTKVLSAKQGVVIKSLIDALQTALDNIKVPTQLSELTDDATHRTVTDAEKETWNTKSNFDGNYNNLSNKPSIPSKTETWTFTLEDGSTVNKVVYVG